MDHTPEHENVDLESTETENPEEKPGEEGFEDSQAEQEYPLMVPEKHELIEVEAEPVLSPEEIMDEKADKIIVAATASAATTCALPIPFADAPILIAEQVGMLAALCNVYKINMKKNALRSIVLAVLGVSGTTIVGKTVFSSLIKLIPGAGSLLGGSIAAATGGALTAALGKAWQALCKDVLSGKLSSEDLTSKDGIKLLTTTLQDQLRLEMKEQEQPEDVLVQTRIPADDEVLITPSADPENSEKDEDVLLDAEIPADDQVLITPAAETPTEEATPSESKNEAGSDVNSDESDSAVSEVSREDNGGNAGEISEASEAENSESDGDEEAAHAARHAGQNSTNSASASSEMRHAKTEE